MSTGKDTSFVKLSMYLAVLFYKCDLSIGRLRKFIEEVSNFKSSQKSHVRCELTTPL